MTNIQTSKLPNVKTVDAQNVQTPDRADISEVLELPKFHQYQNFSCGGQLASYYQHVASALPHTDDTCTSISLTRRAHLTALAMRVLVVFV